MKETKMFGKSKKKDEPQISTPKEADAMVTKPSVPMTLREATPSGGTAQIVMAQDGSISFKTGELEVLKFCPNGKAYVKGELQERNAVLYQHVRRWFEGSHHAG